MSMIQKILVATDFSECSEEALEMAIELGEREGAKLTLLHVCQAPAYAYASGGSMVAPTPELVADLITDTKRALATIEKRLAARNICIETTYMEGEPREVIPIFAAERGYDLIVMGSHGRRGFKRFFVGSVAEHVVRVATMPVLVVHPRAKAAGLAGAA